MLPTPKKLKIELNAVPLTLAKPLRGAPLTGIDRRLGCVFDDSEFLVAAICHPKLDRKPGIDGQELRAVHKASNRERA